MLGWLFRGRDRQTFPYRPKAVREADSPNTYTYPTEHDPYLRNGMRPVIVDDDGWEYSEWEYVDIGIREKWLVYCGYHFSGRICFEHYRLITPE